VSNMTLMDVFFQEKGLFEARLSFADSANALSDLKDKLKKQGCRMPFPFFQDQVVEKAAKDLMNVRIDTILLSAWGKYFSLRKYLDRDKYPENATVTTAIGEHTVKSEHRPFLEILINGIEYRINFGISISLTMKSVILVIKGGRLKAIKPGECSAKGTVTCQSVQIYEKTSQPLVLPEMIDLGEGIPIG
jgi:hypothetical protein